MWTLLFGAGDGTWRATPFTLACSLTLLCSPSARGFKSLFFQTIKNQSPHICVNSDFWCRRRDLNPYGIATNGFWVRHVCQFHHSGEYHLHIILYLYKKIKNYIKFKKQKFKPSFGRLVLLFFIIPARAVFLPALSGMRAAYTFLASFFCFVYI